MMQKMRLAGVCGMLAPLVAFAGIFLALSGFGPFSWQENALSDLGARASATRDFFNTGLIIGGLLCAGFAAGFFSFLKNSAGKAGAILFFLDALALAAIGIFPSGVTPHHYYASVAFFVLFPIAGLAIFASLWEGERKRLAAFTLVVAAVAGGAWILHWTIFPFGTNVATPEMVSALAAGAWAIVLGAAMAWRV